MFKKVTRILFSIQLTVVILIVFGVSIALATFVENDFGAASARMVVYNAFWFEFMLALGVVNLIGNIFSRHLYRKEKLTIFIFHLSFVLILLGAGITRYNGETGTMHIREGEEKRYFLTDENYLTVGISDDLNSVQKHFKAEFSDLKQKHLNKRVLFNGETVKINTNTYVSRAVAGIEPVDDGRVLAEIVLATSAGSQSIILEEDKPVKLPSITFSLNPKTDTEGIQIFFNNDSTVFIASRKIVEVSMLTQQSELLDSNTYHPFKERTLYQVNGNQFVLKRLLKQARKVAYKPENQTMNYYPEAVSGTIQYKGVVKNFTLFSSQHREMSQENYHVEGLNVALSYGSKTKDLPFSLRLNKFILDRYPGSNSPSWYESLVFLNDEDKNIAEERRIFMNNVLNHRGYRFYQSSYDQDEQGTILAVNKDRAGTIVTYLGYLFMAIGMILTLFSKNSRFHHLSQTIQKIQFDRASLIIVMLISGNLLMAQEKVAPQVVSLEHAKKFGELLVLDKAPTKGRVVPVNTYASELLRKIARKEKYNDLIPEQVLLGLITKPDYWQNEPLVKVSHPELQELLQISGKYTSFNNVFSANDNQYILGTYVNEAYRKRAAERSKFDNEVMKVDERMNLLYLAFSVNLLNLFPVPNDPMHHWVSPNDVGMIQTADTVFTKNVFAYYVQALRQATKTDDYALADSLLEGIKKYQQQYGGQLLPSNTRIQTELIYNRLNLFDRISNFYGILGFITLVLLFAEIFSNKILVKRYSVVFKLAVGIVFLMHTGGLIVRWYLSGHAPWSNGYESLIYISWATILAGYIFSRKSIIALAGTAILSYLILHVAHLSWMDPAITNLVPVLNSYWLIIHVAVITASYAFLALGAILALLNLLLMILENSKNSIKTYLITIEISAIIEMTLIIGLYLLSIGTFLGGVWANESWGRYWAWDPKETWALVTILVYAFIAHMRLIPGLTNQVLFNVFSLFGFASVLMTYFGVNYYLSGLHSYAAGDPIPIPNYVFYITLTFIVISVLAFLNQRRMRRNELHLE